MPRDLQNWKTIENRKHDKSKYHDKSEIKEPCIYKICWWVRIGLASFVLRKIQKAIFIQLDPLFRAVPNMFDQCNVTISSWQRNFHCRAKASSLFHKKCFDSDSISFKHFQLKDGLILWSAFNRTNLLHLYPAYCLLGTWAFCTLLVSWANRCSREVRSVNAICICTWDTTWITVDPEPPHELRLHHLVHGNVWRHANTLQNHIRIQLSSAFQMHSFGAASLNVVYYNFHQAICCSKEIHIANAKACSLSYRSRCTRSITTDRMHVPWIKVAWDSKESSKILSKNKTDIIDICLGKKKLQKSSTSCDPAKMQSLYPTCRRFKQWAPVIAGLASHASTHAIQD